MAELKIAEIAEVVQGKVLNAHADTRFCAFHFDTRLIDRDHTLFFALKSDQNDGGRYVSQLQDMGKRGLGAVVNSDFDASGIALPLIRVPDPLKAAHDLAAYVREQSRATKFVGITGSAGKTTTKEFLYQMLAKKYRAYRSYLNWNNWIGLPFSLLQLNGDEQVAVFELAMSYPGIGEIAALARILKPDVAVLLNAYATHLEFLKSVDNVALGKCEILNYLGSDGIGFVNGDSPHIRKHSREKKGRRVYFGRDSKHNDIVLKEVTRNSDQTRLSIDFFGVETEFSAQVKNGSHIENLFAAIIAAQHLGMRNFEIQAAIQQVQALPGRGNIEQVDDFTIVDETYNSNPEALKKSLDWIDREYGGKRPQIAVLGDMLELGEEEERFHDEAGRFFSRLHFDMLVTVGLRAEKIAQGAAAGGFPAENIRHFAKAREAGKFVKESADKGAVILFKASRGIRLEEAVEEFVGE